MDVKTALLYGVVDEEIYMKQPEGYDDGSGRVCRLNKAIYGLKQAPRCWYARLVEVLDALGFKVSGCDESLFMTEGEEEKVFLLVYVDDILLFSPSLERIKEVQGKLKETFQCKALGPVGHYLGLHVERDEVKGWLRLHQHKYLVAMGEKYGLEGGRSVKTPLPSGFQLHLDEEEGEVLEYELQRRFQSMSFGSEFPVVRLHSDRGGEFSSARLGAFCRAQGIRQTFTLPASPQQNGIAECRIGMVMDVARTSMIHAAAPHFLWPFAVQYAAHQLNLQPRVSLPETSPTLLWTGKVGDASAFRDVTFDESVSYYRLFPYRTAPLPPPPLFLAPGSPPVDPFPPQGPAPSGVSQVDAVEPVEVAVDSGAATGAEPAGAGSGGTGSGGAVPGGAESGGAESAGAEPGGAESGGAEPWGAELGSAEPGGAEPGGAGRAAGAGGSTVATGPRGARTGGSGAAGTGGAAAAARVGPAGATGAAGGVGAGVVPAGGAAGAAGGAGAASPSEVGAAGASRAPGAGAAGGVSVGVSSDAGPSAGTGVGAVGAGGAAGAGAAPGGTGPVLGLPPSPSPTPPLECPQPVQLQSLLQPVSPLPAPSPYTGPTGGLAVRREPASRPASPVRAARTSGHAPRQRTPSVLGTHQMALRPSTVSQRVPLPSPPASSLPVLADPESDSLCAVSPTVARLLSTVVTDPSFASSAASALVAELVDFAACCRLDYAAGLVAESASVCPPSVGGECALSTDVLEDRQEEFQCFAAALPHLVSMLIAPDGDPHAPDIPTPRSYAEAIEGPYSSQWQSAMDAEMASWKSTGTYVDEGPPPGANIVSGMWIFRVKRPPGSPPVFKARYVARGF
ncbi:unnamed protein product, partial [Closterium sp. NIES-54]